MGLSNDLISQFVKAVTPSNDKQTETTAYGTVTIPGDGKIYVTLDGSDRATPVSSTTAVSDGDRVTVMIKDHSAIITGNLSTPSINTKSPIDANQVSGLDVFLNGQFKQTLEDVQGDIENLEKADTEIKDTLRDHKGLLEGHAEAIRGLQGADTDFNTRLTNAETNITALGNNKLDKSALEDGKFLANLDKVTLNELEATSIITSEMEAKDARVSGTLTATNIFGSKIEGSTIAMDQLVVLGTDGNYYQINTDFEGITSVTPVDKNKLHGSIIVAKSVTADKILVTDLVAFGAKIGGFHILGETLEEEIVVKEPWLEPVTFSIHNSGTSSGYDLSDTHALFTPGEEYIVTFNDGSESKDYVCTAFYSGSNQIPPICVGNGSLFAGCSETGDPSCPFLLFLDNPPGGGTSCILFVSPGHAGENEVGTYTISISTRSVTRQDGRPGAIYSGEKETIDNSNRGSYLDSEGQFAFGDSNNYIKYYKTTIVDAYVLDWRDKTSMEDKPLYHEAGSSSIDDPGGTPLWGDYTTRIPSPLYYYINNGTVTFYTKYEREIVVTEPWLEYEEDGETKTYIEFNIASDKTTASFSFPDSHKLFVAGTEYVVTVNNGIEDIDYDCTAFAPVSGRTVPVCVGNGSLRSGWSGGNSDHPFMLAFQQASGGSCTLFVPSGHAGDNDTVTYTVSISTRSVTKQGGFYPVNTVLQPDNKPEVDESNVLDEEVLSTLKHSEIVTGLVTTDGNQVYMGITSEGQLIYYCTHETEIYKLAISADSVVFSNSGRTADSLAKLADRVKIGSYEDPDTGEPKPSVELDEDGSANKLLLTNEVAVFTENGEEKTKVGKDSIASDVVTANKEFNQGEWTWVVRDNGHYSLMWKGASS